MDQKESVSLSTLSNAAELAANITLHVFNDQFYNFDCDNMTVDAIRQACIERIQTLHLLKKTNQQVE